MDARSRYAGFWRRAGAFLVDQLWMGLLAAVLLYLAYGPEYFAADGGDALLRGWEEAAIEIAMPLVLTVGFWHWLRATPGKLLLGCLVVDARSGAPLGIGRALLRYVGYLVSALPLGLGFLWIAFDRRRQGFHDKLAGSVVVVEDEAHRDLDALIRGLS